MADTQVKKPDFFYFAEQTSPDPGDVKDFNPRKRTEGDIWWFDFPACMIMFELMNRNTRQYLGDNVWEFTMSEKNKSMMAHGGWFGEQDHPAPLKEKEELTKKRVLNVYMPNRSHKLMNPRRKGNEMWMDIQTCASTEAGRGMAIEIVQGMIPCFSLRSTGQMQIINGKPTVIVNKVVTFDWVLFPGFDGAEAKGTPQLKMKSIFESADEKKGAGDIMIPWAELAGDVAEEDPNVNSYMEAFRDENAEIVDFTDNSAVIRNNGLYVYAGMNERSVKRVKDFYRSFGKR